MDAQTPPAASGANRELIIRAAREEMAVAGYDGTTMRAVARRAGVDPRLVRYYFPSKKILLVETLARSELDLASVAGLPVEVRLLRLCDRQHVECRAVLAGALSGDPELAETFTACVRRMARADGGPPGLDDLMRLGQSLGIWLLTGNTNATEEDRRRREALVAMVRGANGEQHGGGA